MFGRSSSTTEEVLEKKSEVEKCLRGFLDLRGDQYIFVDFGAERNSAVRSFCVGAQEGHEIYGKRCADEEDPSIS